MTVLHLKTHISIRAFHTSSDAYFKYIEKCTEIRLLSTGRRLHARLVINGLARLTHFASKLVSMYAEFGESRHARQLFDKIPKRNYRRWIVLAGAYSKSGFYRDTLMLCNEMQRYNTRPDNYVLPSVLKACGHLSETRTGKAIHGVILRCSYDYDAFVNSALIDMYSRCGLIDKARLVFDNMADKDLVALNAMIKGYVQGGSMKEALCLVVNTRSTRVVKPNVVTWNTLIAGFSLVGDDVMVEEIFRLMSIDGVKPDVISWTSIITGQVQVFRNKQALLTLKKMLDSGYYPTSNTISSLLPACANVANARHGKEIHGYAVVIGVEEDVYVRSALVDMYAKCGFLSQAEKLFHGMHRKNTVTWNSMIFGYANHGYCNKAIELFQEMEKQEGATTKLDHLTFTAALTACSHGRKIELGETLFRLMQEKYGIKPRLEHYACMVDLFSRAGKLRDAYDFIKEMPIEPDLFAWGALLGACREYGNVELAKIAAEHLSELEPQSAGSNVLVSNLYAGHESWASAARLKKMVKKKKLQKLPGCSWIETG